MRLETSVDAHSVESIAEDARRLEEIGYDSISIGETGNDPFLPLMVVAEHTRRIRMGCGVAMAFPRSPFVTAQMAWDLQRFSGGRFHLGLGTQVKGHNERRYSTPWTSPPGPRLREYILCLRAIFDTFQTGARPNFKGEYFQFTLISPVFNPGPNADGHVPIYIAAVNQYNCRLGGELCDGVRLHSFNTARYTSEVILPGVEAGARRAGRKLSEIDIVGACTVVTGRNEREIERAKSLAKQRIAFYGSTRTYSPVLELHGWGEVGLRLHRLSLEGKWQEMANEISDEMLEEFAIVATHDELLPKIKERYGGVVSTLGFAVRDLEDQARLDWLVEGIRRL